MRKVAGKNNPADLFTKHLPSKDKIHQLTALFGCEYREGRALTAPQLRPNVDPAQQDDHLPGDDSFDPLPTFMNDAITHDPNIIPHMYEHEIMEKMLPLIEATVEIVNGRDWAPGDCF